MESINSMIEKLTLKPSKEGHEINRTKTKVTAVQPRDDVSMALEGKVIGRVESIE